MTTVHASPMTVSTSSLAEMATVSSAPPLAASLPAPPPDGPAAVSPLSEFQFRQQLLTTLQTSGTLTSLKTQLKSSIIQQLIQRKLPALLASNNPPAAVQRPLVERLANSLILDYLLALSYTYTHSLFIAELGVNNREEAVFAQHDTLDLLHVSQSTGMGQQLMTALSQQHSADDRKASPPSILLALLSTLHTHNAPATASIAIQTESSLADSLEQKLKAVDDELNSTLLHSHPSFSLALEQRMTKLQRETNERAQHDVEKQVAHYKQVELADARREERDKYQQQLRDMQQQLTAQHNQQLKEHKARLEAAEVEFERKVRAIEEERYVGRQRLMDELDKAKAREAELQRLEMLMKREVGVEAEVWKERNGRLEMQLSTLAEERRRLEERIIEERERVEQQLTPQLVQKDEQLRSLRESSEQLRAQYDKSMKDNLSLTQQLADTQRQHIALSSSSSLIAAAEARTAHVQQQLSDVQRAAEYEKSKHADEVRELMWTANVAVERERDRGHAMLVKLSNEWKDAYDTLMAEYERVEADRERKVWRERSGGGRMERRSIGVARRTAWEDEEESAPAPHDARVQSSSFGDQHEQHRRAQTASNAATSSTRPASIPSSAGAHTTPAPAYTSPQAALSAPSPAPAPTSITITSPPVAFTPVLPSNAALSVPPSTATTFASPATPATTVAASPYPSPTQLDSPLPPSTQTTSASPSPDSLLFTPPASASRPPFASPSSSLPFPALMTPATPATEMLDPAEERRRAVEAVERGREEAKRRQQQLQQRMDEEEDERQTQEREEAERRVREARDAKLRQEEEKKKQAEEQQRKDEADRQAAAAAQALESAREQEAAEAAERQQQEMWDRIEREEREKLEREEAEDREREEREQRELAEVRRLEEKRDREEKNERRRAEREEQKAEEERRRLEEQERQLQAAMTEDEKREEEQREQRRKQQRQEAEEQARQAALQRSQPPRQPIAPIPEEPSYSDDEPEDEEAVKEREKKARMDEFLKRAKERRDKERQAEKDEAERKRREAEEAEERQLQVSVKKRQAEVEEDIEEELEVETENEAYTADEFEAASESGIADEVEVEADEIEEDIEL